MFANVKLCALAGLLMLLAACASSSKPVTVGNVTLNPVGSAAPVVQIAAPVDPFVAAVQRFVGAVSNFTSSDLTWALADATAKKDVVAIPCWQFLLAQAGQLPGAGGNLPPLGLASALQVIRDGVTITSGIPAPFQAACGALILDTQVRIAALAGGIAGGMSGVGIVGPGVATTNQAIIAAVNAFKVP